MKVSQTLNRYNTAWIYKPVMRLCETEKSVYNKYLFTTSYDNREVCIVNFYLLYDNRESVLQIPNYYVITENLYYKYPSTM